MTLVRFLYKKFFPVLAISMVFFVMVLLLADVLMNIWNYIAFRIPARTILAITLNFVPKAAWYAVPISMLFAASYVLSDFYAKNELLAVFASGVPLVRFTAPLLVVSLAMSVAMFVFEDKVVVPTYALKTQMQAKAFNREASLSNDHIVIMSDGGRVVYNAEYYDDEMQRLFTLYVVLRGDDRALDRVIRADSAVWQDGHWVLSGARQYVLDGGDIAFGTVPAEYEALLVEPPETFRNNTISVDEVSVADARAYITRLEKNGLPSAKARANYYKKFSFPFVTLIVVFLAIGLSGKTRKNVLLVSLALSMVAVVLFYVVQMVTMLMAEFEVVPPVMGAWFPVVLFVFLSAVLLRYSKT